MQNGYNARLSTLASMTSDQARCMHLMRRAARLKLSRVNALVIYTQQRSAQPAHLWDESVAVDDVQQADQRGQRVVERLELDADEPFFLQLPLVKHCRHSGQQQRRGQVRTPFKNGSYLTDRVVEMECSRSRTGQTARCGEVRPRLLITVWRESDYGLIEDRTSIKCDFIDLV